MACSMGGSVAVHVAAKKMLPSLAGLVVVDVVEVLSLTLDTYVFLHFLRKHWLTSLQFQGTAIASLMHMQKILSNRVQHFPTIEKAVNVLFNFHFLYTRTSLRYSGL